MCLVSTNLNCTWYPIFADVDLCILMIKQPSAAITLLINKDLLLSLEIKLNENS